MINRKKTINKIAIGVLVITVSLMTFAFIMGGNNIGGSRETVEAFYGKAIFGGQFAWMDNVKNPRLRTSSNLTKSLSFDFDLSNASIDSSYSPSQDTELIASIIEPFNSSGYNGPFDGEAGLSDLIHIEQFLPPAGLNFSSDSSNSATFAANDEIEPIDLGDDENPGGDINDSDEIDPVVVPSPTSISLALIGIAAIIRKRKVE